MKFEVTILGANSAIPTATRFPTSQLLNVNESYYLIDCGEGAQIQLRKYKIKFQRIEAIFISHLHGDHYFGLIGLLTTMHLLRREKALKIYCPEKLEALIHAQLEAGGTELGFPLEFIPLNIAHGAKVMEDHKVKVTALKLKHRIPCAGFVFREKTGGPRMRKEAIGKYKLSIPEIKKLKAGEEVKKEGKSMLELATEKPPAPRTYAYVTDTKPLGSIVPFIAGADLLYHESTFIEKDVDRAKKTYHSTARQAAMIAGKADVGKLLLGHFSTRYRDLDKLLEEAQEVFENTELATEGKTFPA